MKLTTFTRIVLVIRYLVEYVHGIFEKNLLQLLCDTISSKTNIADITCELSTRNLIAKILN